MKLIAPILSASSTLLLLLLGGDATADETQVLRGSNRLLAGPGELFRIKHPYTKKYLEPTRCDDMCVEVPHFGTSCISPKIRVSNLSANDPMQLWYWTKDDRLVNKGCQNKAITLSGCDNGDTLELKDLSRNNSPKQEWIAQVEDGKKGRIRSGYCSKTRYMDKGAKVKVWAKGNDNAQNFIIEPDVSAYSTITGEIYEGKPVQEKKYSTYVLYGTPWEEGNYSGLKDVTVTCFRKDSVPEKICSTKTSTNGSFTCKGKRVPGVSVLVLAFWGERKLVLSLLP